VKRGLQFNAEAGISNGSIPYGFRRGTDGKLEIHETEAAVVQEIFKRVAAGERRSDILDDLNARLVPTRRGGAWKHCTLRVMLLNEVYIGVYHYGGVRLEGMVPQIVDIDTWKEVGRRMKAVKGTRVRSENYLFTGKIRCGLCGEPMIGRSGTGRSGTYAYYVCRGQREKTCTKKAVRRDLLEERVVNCVIDSLNDDSIVGWIADSVVEMQRRETEARLAAPEALRAELADVKQSIKGIINAIEAGIVTASVKERLLELEAEQESLTAAIADASLPVPIVDRKAIVYWLTRFRGAVEEGRGQEAAMRDMANSLIWALRVWDDHAEAILNYSGIENVINVPLLDTLETGDGSSYGDSSWPVHQRTFIPGQPFP